MNKNLLLTSISCDIVLDEINSIIQSTEKEINDEKYDKITKSLFKQQKNEYEKAKEIVEHIKWCTEALKTNKED